VDTYQIFVQMEPLQHNWQPPIRKAHENVVSIALLRTDKMLTEEFTTDKSHLLSVLKVKK